MHCPKDRGLLRVFTSRPLDRKRVRETPGNSVIGTYLSQKGAPHFTSDFENCFVSLTQTNDTEWCIYTRRNGSIF